MSDETQGACEIKATGGVGESGSSRLVHTIVEGEIQKLALVRTVETNLCQNTGALAVITVNGQPAAHGMISELGSSIQAEVNPGDTVCAIVTAIPLFNEIQCIVLGELTFNLEICDLV